MSGAILVLEHQDDVTIDVLGDRFVAAGAELVTVRVGEEPIPELAGWSALVVLGGEANVWQEDRYPWLVGEKAAIRAWMAGPPRPLLGICLGHQLLADALGGEVGPRVLAEAGVRPVSLSDRGRGDALLGPLGGTFASLQWHGAEVRRLPPAGEVLAANPACAVQAMRVGPAAWGVQFHPEVGATTAAEWGEHPVFQGLLDADRGPGGADAYPAALAAAVDAFGTVTSRLAEGFLARIGLSAPSVTR